MKRYTLYIIAAAAMTLTTACSDIGDDERLQYVAPADVNRAVLIEDFTGQRCLNCPAAHEAIAQLQQQYGTGKVIAVSIHGGALAVNSTATILGLRTPTGDSYNLRWEVESWPSGIINRRSGVLTYDQWAARVYEEIQRPAEMQLEVKPEYDADSSVLTVEVKAKPLREFHGWLQVWLTEDSIVAPQQMPDGTMDREYIHNNVLRKSISDTWGEKVVPGGMEPFSQDFRLTLDAEWNPGHLAVVAFAFDGDGVLQAVKVPIRN